MANPEREFNLQKPIIVTMPPTEEEVEGTIAHLTRLIVGKDIDPGQAEQLSNLKCSALEEVRHVYDVAPPVIPPPADSEMKKLSQEKTQENSSKVVNLRLNFAIFLSCVIISCIKR